MNLLFLQMGLGLHSEWLWNVGFRVLSLRWTVEYKLVRVRFRGLGARILIIQGAKHVQEIEGIQIHYLNSNYMRLRYLSIVGRVRVLGVWVHC